MSLRSYIPEPELLVIDDTPAPKHWFLLLVTAATPVVLALWWVYL